jgi:hypothetical protein
LCCTPKTGAAVVGVQIGAGAGILAAIIARNGSKVKTAAPYISPRVVSGCLGHVEW